MVDGIDDGLIVEIQRALRNNSFQRADLAIRELLSKRPNSIEPALLLADLASMLGRWQVYDEARNRTGALGGDLPANNEDRRIKTSQGGHLLITEWGQGFWSDVAHVMGSLLLAEMTGRTPIVYWSDASLFSPEDGNNTWDRYFEPIGPSRKDLPHSGAYFPEPWDFESAQSRQLCQVRSRRPAGTYGIGLLPRRENVIVSDTFVGVADLWPWLETADEDFGASIVASKRRLANRYLRLRPRLAELVERIWSQHMLGRRWLAVHIRGSDKGEELENLAEVNAQYPPLVDQWLAQGDDRSVFLMTDSTTQYRAMRDRYGRRLFALNTIRTDADVGVHRAGHSPVQVAEQVILDTFLATRCDTFIGNGTSNVSLAVEYLKDWENGSFQLVGPDWRESRFIL